MKPKKLPTDAEVAQRVAVYVQEVDLRDRFAMAALPWILQSDAWEDYDDVAESAFGVADSMMRARSKRRKS